MKQPAEIELAGIRFREMLYRGTWKRAARNHHAVKRVRASSVNKTGFRIDRTNDKPGRRINRHGLCLIVETRIKHDHVSPQSVIRHNYRVTKSIVNRQVLPELPGILCKALVHVGAKDGVCTMPNF